MVSYEKVVQYIFKSQLLCPLLVVLKLLLVDSLEAKPRSLPELLVATLLLYLDLTYTTLVFLFQGLISTLEWLTYIFLPFKSSLKKVNVVTLNRRLSTSFHRGCDVVPAYPLP